MLDDTEFVAANFFELGIGDLGLRAQFRARLEAVDGPLAILTHSSAVVWEHCVIGAGLTGMLLRPSAPVRS